MTMVRFYLVVVLFSLVAIYCLAISISAIVQSATGKIWLEQLDNISALSLGFVGVFFGTMVLLFLFNKKVKKKCREILTENK